MNEYEAARYDKEGNYIVIFGNKYYGDDLSDIADIINSIFTQLSAVRTEIFDCKMEIKDLIEEKVRPYFLERFGDGWIAIKAVEYNNLKRENSQLFEEVKKLNYEYVSLEEYNKLKAENDDLRNKIVEMVIGKS